MRRLEEQRSTAAVVRSSEHSGTQLWVCTYIKILVRLVRGTAVFFVHYDYCCRFCRGTNVTTSQEQHRQLLVLIVQQQCSQSRQGPALICSLRYREYRRVMSDRWTARLMTHHGLVLSSPSHHVIHEHGIAFTACTSLSLPL